MERPVDEAQVRSQICKAVQQLWMRGMVVGSEGLVTMAMDRRHFLTTPTGQRLADLQPADLLAVDLGGVEPDSDHGVDAEAWRPHRIAYQVAGESAGEGRPAGGNGRHGVVRATVFAQPPLTIALASLRREMRELHVTRHPAVPMVDPRDDVSIQRAVAASPLVALGAQGVLASAATVAEALNTLEELEHAVGIELTVRGRG